MAQLDQGALSSAMQGYTPPSSQPQSNPLDSILPMALQIAGMIGGGAIGGPMGAMAGSGLGTGAGELLTGQALNPAQMGQSALFGMMPGMGGAKAAADVASTVGEDVAGTAAKDATASDLGATGTTTPSTITPLANGNASIEDLLNPQSANNTNQVVTDLYPKPGATDASSAPANPTNLDPTGNMGHVNFNKDETGNPVADTNNTFAPPETPQEPTTPPETPSTSPTPNVPVRNNPPQQVPATGTQTSPDDTFTQVNPTGNPQLNLGQKAGSGAVLSGLKQQVQEGGSRLTQAKAAQVAQNLMSDGYTSLGDAAHDASLTTGDSGILSNGVNDHVINAENNGSTIDLHDYNQLAAKNISDGRSSGVLSPAQQKAAIQTLNETKNVLAGPNATSADYDPTGELSYGTASHIMPSNVMTTVRALQARAHTQDLIAERRGPAADGAKQMSQIYNNMGRDLIERSFGGATGNAPISDTNLDNMISQVKSAPYKNTQYQQNLMNTLESGKGGNISLQDLRHMQANHVGYSKAANPDEIGNLANSLMSVGIGKAGVANAVLNSTPGQVAKTKVGQFLTKISTPSSSEPPSSTPTSGGTPNNIVGGKSMSPLGKALAIAGIGGAGVLGANSIATANQGQQAQAMLNDPDYQKTQAILAQSNELQRALGQQGEIRSIFAPTFDTNAGQAGTMGQSMLQSANQNQAARQAAANLLAARAAMGSGGLLGGALSLVPGTNQNAYAQQAGNAQAQLNALGIAGTAPGAAQSGSTIPALSSMAGAVGNF